MFFKRAMCVTLTLAVTPCLAQVDDGLVPRTPVPKQPNHRLTVPARATGRVLVKFNDNLRVRVTANGQLMSQANYDLSAVQQLVDEFGLDIYPAFEQSEAVLTELQTRAAMRTGKAQPDLSGMMYVEGPANMMPAAHALNSLELVEYVSFDQTPTRLDDGGAAGGGFMICSEATDTCFDAHPTPGCVDTACCNEVCNAQPFCCDFFWDDVCVALAGFLCEPVVEPACGAVADPCNAPHAGVGCADADCCNIICAYDPSCCETEWDVTCAGFAQSICEDSQNPNFEILQGYTQTAFGGYDLDFLREVGEDLTGLGFGERSGALGHGIKVGVIEDAYIEGHEDLTNVILEPGQEILDIPAIVDPHHGTACLSEIVGENNGYGVTGIAYEAQGYFFPTVSASQPGGRLLSSIASALSMFEPGDVISFSIGFPPGPLETDTSVFLLFRLATDLGIITVQAAGNSCFNLDNDIGAWHTNIGALGPTGSTIVGAGLPVHPPVVGGDCPTLDMDDDPCELAAPGPYNPPPYSKLDFSNFFITDGLPINDPNRRVHVQGWGANVMAAGYGNLYQPGGDIKRSYTHTFGGTSAAAPMTAGVMACVQGVAKQFFGIPLGPTTVRGLVGGAAIPQDGAIIEQFVTGRQDPDTDPCNACCRVPEEDPELIGGFPFIPGVTSQLLTNAFFDGSPFIDDVTVFRGDLLQGNSLSIKESDDLRLVIRSEYTEPSDSANETGEGPDPVYYLFAQTTDIEISATIGSNPDVFVDNVVLDIEGSSTAVTNTSLLVAEAYNWNTGRREFLGFYLQDQAENNQVPTGPLDYMFNIPNAARYVSSDGRMLLRFWTVALGGTTISEYTQRYDFVAITATDDQGEVIPPPGG